MPRAPFLDERRKVLVGRSCSMQRPFGSRNGLFDIRPGYRSAMTNHPHQSESDEADPEKQSTPAGVVRDLEEEAEEMGASTDAKSIPGQPPAK